MTHPIVSVIVPCYNQAQYLSESLDSVISQTYPSWECIIVNDGSPDNTEEIALKYCEIDSRIRYHKKQNGGLADARNAGIAISTGEYILPLDADDKIGSNYLSEGVDILNRNISVKIVYCDAVFFGEKNGKWLLPTFDLKNMLLYNHIFCSSFFRRVDYECTNGYDKAMKFGWEDWEFWLAILENGGDVYKLNNTNFFYRIRIGSLVSSMNNDHRVYLRKIIYLKHNKMYDSLFSDPISLYEENLNLKKKCERLESSIYYRVGKVILFPVKFIYNLFRQ